MKVLLINGSPHKEGNTFIALSEVAKALEANLLSTICLLYRHNTGIACMVDCLVKQLRI